MNALNNFCQLHNPKNDIVYGGRSVPPPTYHPVDLKMDHPGIVEKSALCKNKGLIKGYSARTEEQRTFGTPCTCFCRRFGDQEIQQMLFAMNCEGVGVIQRTICPLFKKRMNKIKEH